MAGNIQKDAPLFMAVHNMNTGLVKQLLAEGADPNVRGEFNRTPLHIAALMYLTYPANNYSFPTARLSEIYYELLKAGSDPNIIDDLGYVADDFIRLSPNLHNFEKKKKEFNTLKGIAALQKIQPEAEMYTGSNVYTHLDAKSIKDLHDYSGGIKRRKTIRRRKTIKRRKSSKRRVKRARK
jgi:hypothetical protein